MANKKLAKAKCKDLKKQERADCLEAAEDEIHSLNDMLIAEKENLDDTKKSTRKIVTQINQKFKKILNESFINYSQESIIDDKCIKKPKKKKKGKVSESIKADEFYEGRIPSRPPNSNQEQ